ALDAFATNFVDVCAKTPHRGSTRCDLDETVDAEADERNASGESTSDDRGESFERVVSDGGVAQPLPSSNEGGAIEIRGACREDAVIAHRPDRPAPDIRLIISRCIAIRRSIRA